jgi:hypothetical protein
VGDGHRRRLGTWAGAKWAKQNLHNAMGVDLLHSFVNESVLGVVMQKIPARFTPLLIALLMSMMMAFLMSGVVTFLNKGLSQNFVSMWLHAFIKVWPIAFSLLFVLRPLVMRLVSYLVETPPHG